jgi:hypothetical protein
MAKKTEEVATKTLQQQLDAITFKNEQAAKIKAMQEGKEKLKDRLGKNKARRVSSSTRIKGLQGLQTL